MQIARWRAHQLAPPPQAVLPGELAPPTRSARTLLALPPRSLAPSAHSLALSLLAMTRRLIVCRSAAFNSYRRAAAAVVDYDTLTMTRFLPFGLPVVIPKAS